MLAESLESLSTLAVRSSIFAVASSFARIFRVMARPSSASALVVISSRSAFACAESEMIRSRTVLLGMLVHLPSLTR
jgi:hypothetical protein